MGKVLIQIQQTSLSKDGEREHCIIKCPELMERSVDEDDDDDGYDKDIVNSGIYIEHLVSQNLALKYSALCSSVTSPCLGMLNMTMNQSSDIWHQTELPYKKLPGLQRSLMPS